MGVDWYPCSVCGETFPDCGPYVYCGCGRKWCSDECAEQDDYTLDVEIYEEGDCKFCRKEDVEDAELFAHCLYLLNMTRDEVVTSYLCGGDSRGQL